MESILKTVSTLESQLIQKVGDVDGLIAENEVAKQINKDEKKNLAERLKDLKVREDKVKPIEDVVAFEIEARNTMLEAKKLMKLAILEQENLVKAKEDYNKFVAKIQVRINGEDARILDEKKSLKIGYEQLNKAQSEAQDKVAKAIEGAGFIAKNAKK